MTTLTLLAPQAFDRACERLEAAQSAYTEALNTLSDAKCSLEFRRAGLLRKGELGKNAETREANLRLERFDDYAELLGLEASLNDARSELERAKTSWDCLRYKLRLLEVQRALKGAA